MRDLSYRLQAAGLRLLLACISVLPLRWRRRVMAWVTEWAVRLTPLRRRARANLRLVWPDMAEDTRRRILRDATRNIGRTLTGIWYNADFAREVADLPAGGPGLDTLRAAHAEGRGAIVVSGHFGQWEAIRHVLRREGMETGAIYRPNNNPYYEPIFREGIEQGGQPIIAKGRAGNRDLLRHLRAGGFVALLPDQFVKGAPLIPFLGHPARTSLAAAELALRYDLPLVPAFAPEVDGRIRIVFEAAIPHSDAETMMRDFNDRLSSWVTRHPSQWHWLHLRWKAKGGRKARARADQG
ncbi:lysophospholipid acyltransferase family protein [Jannaschia sp. S6380]|uniref:lysophospholipid acyltransferase family protein n=1 Tax=Jannaschia sp. S6380 TaxID=2926408 RepID=UPI001FF1520F|nr:lysophospholipid acyltransferase family protein [Jannaschia sp. S6380]MCK0168615.1 lysophospholipid acyltransferase family protein [Jannaschia sp. S6380]